MKRIYSYTLTDFTPDIIYLIAVGVYSLYTLKAQSNEDYILVVNTGEWYRVSSTGKIIIGPESPTTSIGQEVDQYVMFHDSVLLLADSPVIYQS